MNRRKVLQGLATIPFMAAFAGCHRNSDRDDTVKPDPGKSGDSYGASKIRTLQVILQGPFAVVVQKDRNYRIQAYVPYDDGGKHEFRFPGPLAVQNKHKFYQFRLEEDSLELSGRPPYIDRGFDGFNVQLPEWHSPSDSFVSLDLPAPDVIGYMPPALPVLFEPSAAFPQGQFTTLPLNHILEYRVKEGCKVHLRSRQLGDCIPLTCDDLYQQQTQLRKKLQIPETHDSQRPSTAPELIRCSQSDVCTFFLGVGLAPRMHEDIVRVDRDHALEFFNKKLLPSLYGPNIPAGKKIDRLNVTQCSPSIETAISPVLTPAVRRLRFPQPGPLNVVATENCTSPTVTATSVKTVG